METEPIHPPKPVHHLATPHRLARRALFSFLLTFVISRATVFLIMSKTIPNMYFFLKGTHVHHLNYGIFLLAAVAGYVIFRRPVGRAADITAIVYGIALGLTFDEFGMWLHLGGSYWQRVSVDAVIVVAALIGLVGFVRSLERFEARHFWAFVCLAVVLIGFVVVLYWSGNHLSDLVGPKLRDLESSSSP
jgi:type III secretory pathway component EscS